MKPRFSILSGAASESALLFVRTIICLIAMFGLVDRGVALDLDPKLVGSWPGYPRGEAMRIVTEGKHAYIAVQHLSAIAGGMQVMDISDPANPQLVGSFISTLPPTAIAVSANHAYLLEGGPSYGSILEIVDVHNPAHPRKVADFEIASHDAITVVGSYAYIGGEWGLEILDISEPARPRKVVGYQIGTSIYSLAISANTAYLVTGVSNVEGEGGLEVFDVSDRASPRHVRSFAAAPGARGLAVAGNYAYVSAIPTFKEPQWIPAGLYMIDISDPAAPRRRIAGLIGTNAPALNPGLNLPPARVIVSGNFAYFASQSVLQVLDIANPTGPAVVATHQSVNRFNDLALSGNHAYLVSDAGLEVVDIRNPVGSLQRVSFGQISGSAEGILISGERAYIADGAAGLRVMDVRDAAHPRSLGSLDTSGLARDVAIAGNLACVADGFGGLELIDISDPANLKSIGGYRPEGQALAVALAGNFALVSFSPKPRLFPSIFSPPESPRLEMIDISDAARPKAVATSHPKMTANDMPIGQVRDIAVSGNFAYLAVSPGWSDASVAREGFEIINIANPTNVQSVAALLTRGGAYAVAISGAYAYLVDDAGLQVIDISSPANPRTVSSARTHWYAPTGVTISGHFALIVSGGTDGSDLIEIYDVSDPASPRKVGGYDTGGDPLGIAALGNYAYVADGFAGLKVIDISRPANPQRIGVHESNGGSRDVAVSGNYAYGANDANGLQVMDIRDPSRPQRVSGYDTIGQSWGVAVAGNHAYMADMSGGLQVIDISTPLNPRLAGTHQTMGLPTDIAVSGDYAYLAMWRLWTRGQYVGGGLEIVDIRDPSRPQRAGGYHDDTFASAVAVSGNYAYLLGRGIQIFEISDPRDPKLISIYPATGGGIALSGNYALVTDYTRGLELVDVSDPKSPRKVGSYEAPGAYGSVVISGNYAYLASHIAGLQVIDISIPSNLRRVGGNFSLIPTSVTVDGDKLYVAGYDGLGIFEQFRPLFHLNLSRLPSGQNLNLAVSGPSGFNLRLQRSTDLRDWEEWKSITLTESLTNFVDTATSTLPRRFYRVVSP